MVPTDTVRVIQKVAIAAAVMIGLSLLAGFPVLVLVITKKLPKPICFLSLAPAILAFVASKYTVKSPVCSFDPFTTIS